MPIRFSYGLDLHLKFMLVAVGVEMKKSLFCIAESTFKSSINIFLNYTFEEIYTFLKGKGMEKLDKDHHEGVQGIFFMAKDKDGVKFLCIWIKKFDWTLHHQAIFAHELIHAVASILSDKGVLTTDDNNEPFAY